MSGGRDIFQPTARLTSTDVPKEHTMNGLRKLIGLLAVFACAVFALPGIVVAKGGSNGTDKAYSLVMDEQAEYTTAIPPTVKVPVMVQATLKNEAPPSTSA